MVAEISTHPVSPKMSNLARIRRFRALAQPMLFLYWLETIQVEEVDYAA